MGGTFELVQHTVQGTINTPADLKARWFGDSKDSSEDKKTDIQLGESSDIKLRSESLFAADLIKINGSKEESKDHPICDQSDQIEAAKDKTQETQEDQHQDQLKMHIA